MASRTVRHGASPRSALSSSSGSPCAGVGARRGTGPPQRITRRPSEAGAAIEVYPLALPDGEGASIPLGQWGEVGFANRDGLLVLTVPWSMAGWLRQRLGDAIVRGAGAGPVSRRHREGGRCLGAPAPADAGDRAPRGAGGVRG